MYNMADWINFCETFFTLFPTALNIQVSDKGTIISETATLADELAKLY